MKCSNCGAEMSDGAVFCASCGSRAETPANTCRQCNAPILPGAQFCNNCGAAAAIPNTNPVSSGNTCPQCSAPVLPDAVFCPNCGGRIQAAASYAPPVQQPYAAQPGAPVPPNPYAQPYANPYAQPVPPVQPKRRKKGLLTALIVIVILVVALGGVYALFGRQIKRMILGPKATYLAIEGKAMKQNAEDLVDKMVKYGNRDAQPEKSGGEIDIKFSLDEEKLGIDPVMATALENITIKDKLVYDYSNEKNLYFNQLNLMASDESLLTVESYYDTEQIILTFPELISKSLAMTSDEISSYAGMTGMDPTQSKNSFDMMGDMVTMDLGIDEAKLKKSFNKIIDITMDNIDKAEFKAGQPLKAGDVSAKYDLYTITVSKESARAMFLEIFKTLRDDEEFYNLISKFATYGAAASGTGAEAEFTLEQYQTSLDEAIAEIEDESNDAEDFTMVEKIYVDGDDQVVGRDLTIESADGTKPLHISFAHPVDGSKEAVALTFEVDAEAYSYTSSYTVKDDKKTGTAVISANGADVLTLKFKDLIKQEIGSSEYLLGTIDATFKAPETGSDVAIPTPTGLTYTGKADGDRYEMNLDIPGFFGIQIGLAEIAGSDVKMPTYEPTNLVKITDQAALSELMTPDVQAKFMEIVQKLGLMPAY